MCICAVGKPVKLSLAAEEVALFFAQMLDHEYTTKDVFRDNFFKDWRKVGGDDMMHSYPYGSIDVVVRRMPLLSFRTFPHTQENVPISELGIDNLEHVHMDKMAWSYADSYGLGLLYTVCFIQI